MGGRFPPFLPWQAPLGPASLTITTLVEPLPPRPRRAPVASIPPDAAAAWSRHRPGTSAGVARAVGGAGQVEGRGAGGAVPRKPP
jgi:hypothetical protein